MNEEQFIIELKKIGISIEKKQLELLNKYYKLLVEENKKMNLTRIIDKKNIYLKHFYDSLTLIKIIDLKKSLYLCDIGTGAGFPGVVLKIIFPNIRIVLVDSLNKRILFLNKIISELGLTGIEAIHERAEVFSKNNKNKFDIVTSRAVARSEILIELSIPLLKINGHAIFMKANCEEEIDNLKKLVSKYNSNINNIIIFKLPIENSNRTLIDIQKKGPTSTTFPRSIEKIKKENIK